MKYELKHWSMDRRKQVDPPFNMDGMLDLAFLDNEKKEERYQKMHEHSYLLSKEKAEQMEKISQRYDVHLPTLDNHSLTDQQLMLDLVNQDESSYYTYKKQSDIKRTLIKSHFKLKRKSGRRLKTEKFTRSF